MRPVDLIRFLASEASVKEAARLALAGPRVLVRGSQGSSSSFFAAATAHLSGRAVVLVVAHLDEADEALDELTAAGVDAVRLPALEVLPGETGVSLELFAERLGVVRRMLTPAATHPTLLVCPIQSLMQPVPGPRTLDMLARTVRIRDRLDPGELVRWLAAAGYERADAIEEPGQFAVRGGIIDVFPPPGSVGLSGASGKGSGAGIPVRLDFFGDDVERITEIDLDTMGSDRAVEHAELLCASLDKAFTSATPERTRAGGNHAREHLTGAVALDATGGPNSCSFLDYVPASAIAMLHEPLEIVEQARGYSERLTDPRIYGPPAVLKLLQERFAGQARNAGKGPSGGYMEISQFSGAKATGDVEIELPVQALAELSKETGEAVKELAALAPTSRIAIFCENAGELSRLGELLDEFAPRAKSRIETRAAYVHRGFVWAGIGDAAVPPTTSPLLVVPYHELLHRFETRRRFGSRGRGESTRLRAARAMDTFLDYGPGDYVVHRDHGIALFRGLIVMRPREVKRDLPVELPSDRPKKKAKSPGSESRGTQDPDEGMEEYLHLEFSGGTQLYIPATKIDHVQKYIGGFRGKPALSAIGGTRWKKQKDQVSESVKDLAGEMLRLRAARDTQPGVRYPTDTPWQREFEEEFPFTETEDQLAAIVEIKKDMMSERPMDRLLCGDVGYGKTEVAMRGAFKAVEFGKQVAILVPTTVLAEQHERTFRSRFADYPFRIESISRFKTNAQINAVLADLRKGQVDIIIGTHRLLSRDVRFADLGLVVIDEEQRFGVEHKERLLALRLTVDVLTLSATPIPRTLHLSMLGLRDISSLATAPMDRRAVVTEVIPYNTKRLERAITRELARDGQVFFVHNRVHNIQSVADEIQKLAPEARIVVGHGQMPDGELEEVMLTFMRRQADILVSTTIIESGIDIPTANTMFINDADRFGLADLHQLRGRVGRYKHRAYCYMLLPAERTVTEKAVRRLKAIEEFSMLGAGFKIAMRDLEIRGAGNILGPEQSGHIAAVGYEMYCQLLDRAVKELRHEPTQQVSETSIEIGVSGMIPKRYIPSDLRRMEAYRRLAVAQTPEELEKIETELGQAYGPALPAATLRLLELAALRIAASALVIRAISVRGQDVILRAKPKDAQSVAERLRSAGAAAGASSRAGPSVRGQTLEFKLTILPPKQSEEMAEIYFRPPPSYLEPNTLLRVLRTRLAPSPAAA
jgi:transcription-repair coupling factor (superfamily II helicase)